MAANKGGLMVSKSGRRAVCLGGGLACGAAARSASAWEATQVTLRASVFSYQKATVTLDGSNNSESASLTSFGLFGSGVGAGLATFGTTWASVYARPFRTGARVALARPLFRWRLRRERFTNRRASALHARPERLPAAHARAQPRRSLRGGSLAAAGGRAARFVVGCGHLDLRCAMDAPVRNRAG